MKKRDILTPVGITLGTIMIMFGILSSGGASGFQSFIQISSIVIVLGGLMAALIINFNIRELKLTYRVFKESFNQNDLNLRELITGLLALETELEDVEDPFIRKGVLLAVDGIEPEVIQEIMEAEITALEERHQRGRSIIEKAGEYAPAWGMIGTLIGLVLMLNSLTDPTTLGPKMAVALLTTFYGTVMANLVFIPMAGKLENKTEQETFLKQIIIEGVIGVQSGQNPKILEEKLSAFLSDEEKQETKEQEEAFMGEAANEV